MKMKIEIDTQTFIRFWMVVLGFIVAAFAIYSARTALIMIGAALFLAVTLNAPVSWVARYLPGRSRIGGTAIAFVMVVAILGAFMTLVLPPIVQQTAKFVETVPAIVDTATTQYKSVNDLIIKYHLETQVNDAVVSVKKNATDWAGSIGSSVVGSISTLASFLVSLAFVLVLAFLMLIEGPMMLTKLWQLYEDKGTMEYHRNLVHRMYNVVTGYVIGQLTIAGIGSIVMGIFVLILSLVFEIPANLAIPAAAIYFILSLIPMFGSSIAAILIALLMVINAPVAALVFAIGFIIYQQIENNVVAPTVQSKRMELTALWVLIAVTIGIYVFGIVGGIISIPIAGCLKVLFDDYVAHARAERAKNKRPVTKLIKKIQHEI